MCSTYEPGKVGPFILSLSTDVEFQLNAMDAWIDIFNSELDFKYY